ncbi:MAG: peptidoglycan editing factor PgeF [Candidatus Sericytochromatia bacterium]|nr:peptidoglycan editing factor PgeF [Candidatus Tanganyikabacteria bacterium]
MIELPEGWELAGDGQALRCAALPARHAFSTRMGGVSEGLYGSLNVGMHSGDAGDRVRENRERFRVAGAFDRVWIAVHQVHGPDVAVVDDAGRADREQADAVVCGARGVPVAVYTADCTPILLADRHGRAVAAIHAGWRGTAAGVVARAIESLARQFDVAARDLVAAIGPAARRCCYEVGEEVVAALEQADPGPTRDDREGWQAVGPRRPHVDLPVLVRRQLRAGGVPAEFIYASGICTLCRADLCFSYRRDGQASGRMVSVVQL